MSDNLYKQITARLKEVKPEPVRPDDLTNRIMEGIDKKRGAGRKLFIHVNQKQWQIIQGFRIITTTAAVVMIFFFTLEQKAVNEKISRLEQQVARQSDLNNGMTSQASYTGDQEIVSMPDSLKNIILINRGSLNFMLERIRELENENKTLKEKFLEMYGNENTK